jgi:flagellar M-ring protein FliF
MNQIFQQIGKFWNEIGKPQRLTITAAGVGVLLGIGGLLYWAQKPDMKLLYGKLGEKEAAEVVQVLEEQSIPYQIAGGGSSIYVPSKDVYRVRMDLASKGLPNTGGVGFEIFDRSNFGISDFVQRTNYSRAIQGELAQTIEQMQGVKKARVMVVLPESRLLVRTTDSRPTASVFVDTGSGKLDVAAVNSIRSLVANSIEGLKLDDVAVVDNAGNVLSEDLKSDPQLGSASSIVKYRQQTEDYLSSKVETMLAKVLGPGNSVVRVSATINTEASTVAEEKFDPEGQVPRQETTIEDSSTTSEKAAQEPPGAGVAANVPPDQANEDQQSNKSSNTVRSSRTQSYEINKTMTSVVKNPGAITRITAAVFLSTKPGETGEAVPRTPEQITALRGMVINALGIAVPKGEDASNYVSIQEVDFPSSITQPTGLTDQIGGYMELIRPIAALVIAAIVFAIFFIMLRRARPEQISFELVDDAIGNPSKGALRSRSTDDPNSLLPSAKSLKVSPELLNSLIRQKPENVGATLREWLTTKSET